MIWRRVHFSTAFVTVSKICIVGWTEPPQMVNYNPKKCHCIPKICGDHLESGLLSHQVLDLDHFKFRSKTLLTFILKWFILDHLYRYGAAARRGAVRSVCWANDALPMVMLTTREHDPNFVCRRRIQGQITCAELSCEQCETNFINLTSFTNHIVVGAVGALVTYNVHLHERHQMLSRLHGLVLPSDVNWHEMRITPTGTHLLEFFLFWSLWNQKPNSAVGILIWTIYFSSKLPQPWVASAAQSWFGLGKEPGRQKQNFQRV